MSPDPSPPQPIRRPVQAKDLLNEPCRLFFPLGVLWALVGVLFWIPKGVSPAFEAVSSKVHVYVQVYGFLWAFAIGFLGTAIPRFSGTRWLTPAEVLIQIGLSIASVSALMLDRYVMAHACFTTSALLLLLSLGIRLARRRQPLPPTAVFVPFGLVSATAGGAILTLAPFCSPLRLTGWIQLGQTLLFQGVMLFFLMGIGGFLIRSILGWQAMPTVGRTPPPAAARTAIGWHLAGAVILLASFPIECFLHPRTGLILRATVVTLECILQLQIHRKPVSGKLGAAWIQAGLWLLVIGLWGLALASPTYRLAYLHLCFIGGFGMSLVGVATRVLLSHGGFRHRLDRQSPAFVVAMLLMWLGLVTRFSVEFMPTSATRHLTYAASAWSLGLLVWAAAYLPKAFSRPPDDAG